MKLSNNLQAPFQTLNSNTLKIKTTFACFRKYCKSIAPCLNEQDGYYCDYKTVNHPLLRDHDAQYLLIEHRGAYLIKINILYSLAYQIPQLFFNIYDMETCRPLKTTQISQKFYKIGNQSMLWPGNHDTGIYVSQNMLTQQYMYTLHSCQLSLEVQYLIPFYLSLLELHPVLPAAQKLTQ